MRLALTAALALTLSGCVSVKVSRCAAGERRAEVAQVFFGRNVGDRVGVSEADFQGFLDAEVTPRFPDGLSVSDAAGQWKGAAGPVREPSKVLTVVLKPGDRAKLGAITAAYKARFQQESVLTIVERGCVRF